MNVLEKIVDATRQDLRERRERVPLRDLEQRLSSGRTEDQPAASASATSAAPTVPLKESGAITTRVRVIVEASPRPA